MGKYTSVGTQIPKGPHTLVNLLKFLKLQIKHIIHYVLPHIMLYQIHCTLNIHVTSNIQMSASSPFPFDAFDCVPSPTPSFVFFYYACELLLSHNSKLTNILISIIY